MSSNPDTLVFEDIKRHLDGLNRTTDGQLLYRMIERSLVKQGIASSEPVTDSFIRFMHALLGRYANDSRANPVTRVKARLIQQHLSVHMTDMPETVARKKQPTAATPESKTTGEKAAKPAMKQADARTPKAAVPRQAKAINAGAEAGKPEIGNTVSAEVKNDLARKIADTVEQNREFNKLLKSNLRVLKLADNAEDLMDLKSLLVKGMEELLEGAGRMGGDLGATSNWLNQVVKDHQNMQQKLAKAARQSPLDVITGLPKRDAMQGFIKAEVSRAQRYGFSMGLALLRVNDMEAIGSSYGKQATDNVLQLYGSDVLSRLRSYDVAVRYGVDQFAILLPNTQKNGAEKTLEKLQKLASELVFQAGSKTLNLPGFSSVLTMHAAGENAETLLARADEALAMLNMNGGKQNLYLAPTQ